MDESKDSSSTNQPIVESGDSLVTSETKKCDSLSEKPRTLHTTKVFGLGPAICNDDGTITGCRLPTCLQVLRCMMMYH